MRAVEVVGVRVEMPSNQPIVLLKELDGERYLPIWIGAVEATAIAFAQQGVVPDRPLTHDLLKEVISAHDSQVEAVNIVALEEGVFFADLVFANGLVVTARPSDAIALALRTETSIYVADDVFDEAAVELPEEGPDENVEVEKFREFLDQISPEDFGAGPQPPPEN
ncbi:MAG: bifunctional nuclease family protein [Candidatus Nanopelagicales bacterium]